MEPRKSWKARRLEEIESYWILVSEKKSVPRPRSHPRQFSVAHHCEHGFGFFEVPRCDMLSAASCKVVFLVPNTFLVDFDVNDDEGRCGRESRDTTAEFVTGGTEGKCSACCPPRVATVSGRGPGSVFVAKVIEEKSHSMSPNPEKNCTVPKSHLLGHVPSFKPSASLLYTSTGAHAESALHASVQGGSAKKGGSFLALREQEGKKTIVGR